MDQIRELLARYDSLGPHRTGGDNDAAVTQWMAALLSSHGLQTSVRPFEVKTIVEHTCELLLGGERFELMPCHDSCFPQVLYLEGAIGTGETSGIRVTQASTMGHAQLSELRAESKAAALIIFTLGSRSGLTPLNAEHFATPFAAPAFFLSGEHRARVLAMLEQHPTAILRSRVVQRVQGSSNIVAIKSGTQPTLPPIVVFTPRTGWWHCASERGGGLACLFSLAQALQSIETTRTVVLAITSGHELGYLGMSRLIQEGAFAPIVNLWLHLGANFSARMDPLFFMQASSAALEQDYLMALERQGIEPDIIAPHGGDLSGEGEYIPKRSAYVSLQGGNAFFHHPDDRFPDAVDIGKLAKICKATIDFTIKQAAAEQQSFETTK